MKTHRCLWLNVAALLVLLVAFIVGNVVPARADTLLSFTTNNYADITPQINAKGQVCWAGWDGQDYEIYYNNGSGTNKITNNNYDDLQCLLNSEGQIAWSGYDGHDWEIYVYNNNATTQITTNNYEDGHYEFTLEGQNLVYGPRINDIGTITWSGWDGNDYEVYVYDLHHNMLVQVTDNSYADVYPTINDGPGTVVWSGYDGQDYEIYLYNSYQWIIFNNPQTPDQITNNSTDDVFAQVNENSQLAWNHYDGHDWEIYYDEYYGGDGLQLTNNSSNDYLNGLNNLGRAVWQGYDGNDWEVYLYSHGDGATTQITNNSYHDINPQINPGGWVVWNGSDGSDDEIFVHKDSVTSQLTNNNFADGPAQINGSGQIVWSGNDGNDTEIYRLTSGSGTLSRYDFTYHFASGDYYSGYFYALANAVYVVGDTFITRDADGHQGYYQITNAEISLNSSWAGLIVNTSYYDADTDQTYTPVTGYIRREFLGSENDDIIQAMEGGYHFGGGYAEADGLGYRCYDYTVTYGNGDYYTGRFYSSITSGPDIGDSLGTTDENGLAGEYRVTGYTSMGTDSTHQGEMYIDSYYDQETDKTYIPVSYGTPVAAMGEEDGPPHDYDYIIQEGVPEYYFGGGYYEADVDAFSRYAFNFYYKNGSDDYYTGYVYAPTSFQTNDLQFAVGKKLYEQPMTLWASGYKSFNGSCYEITAITDGFAATYDKQSYITAYYDHDTAGASLGVNSDRSATVANIFVADRTAAWETGYAVSGANHASFNPYTEADVTLATSPALLRSPSTVSFMSPSLPPASSLLDDEQYR